MVVRKRAVKTAREQRRVGGGEGEHTATVSRRAADDQPVGRAQISAGLKRVGQVGQSRALKLDGIRDRGDGNQWRRRNELDRADVAALAAAGVREGGKI